MKASLLRSATILIEELDKINADIETMTKGDFTHVTVIGKTTFKYKPLKARYKEYLLLRKEQIKELLVKMGVKIDE